MIKHHFFYLSNISFDNKHRSTRLENAPENSVEKFDESY